LTELDLLQVLAQGPRDAPVGESRNQESTTW